MATGFRSKPFLWKKFEVGTCSPRPMPKWMWKECCQEQRIWPRHSSINAADPETPDLRGAEELASKRLEALSWGASGTDASRSLILRSIGKRCVSKPHPEEHREAMRLEASS